MGGSGIKLPVVKFEETDTDETPPGCDGKPASPILHNEQPRGRDLKLFLGSLSEGVALV